MPTDPSRTGLALEAELNRERSGALARIGRKLEASLARCAELEASLSGVPEGAERTRRLAAYREAWHHAERMRWFMIVQREAMGLTRHDDVELVYPTPRRLHR